LAPMTEEAPPLQPENPSPAEMEEKRPPRNKPIMNAGAGL